MQKQKNGGREMNEIPVVEVFMNGAKVGRIALTLDRLCAFEYDLAWLASGVSISPYFLPLRREVFVAKRTPFNGNFGVFDDSLPDGWGGVVLDRYLRSQGKDPARLTALQRLALVGSSGRGALEYRPDMSSVSDDSMADLDRLAAEAKKILATEYNGTGLDEMYRYAGSSGGARPKVFVRIDGREWLVKFRAQIDPPDVGKVEYRYSQLARECGIRMPETRLFEGKYFGVERFDRIPSGTSGGKIHTVSAAGLLNANYREPSLDYSGLLKLCLNLTRNMEQVYALFRQMVFNVSIGNRDDHAKNFSFQLVGDEWRLSPAYDLLPGDGFNGSHTTTVNGSGAPTDKDMLAVAAGVGLSRSRATEILEEIKHKTASSQ
jgi:serine/threonine-protein kinase HipA